MITRQGMSDAARFGLVAALAAGVAATTAQGGNNPVTTVPLVFVPPVFVDGGVMSAAPGGAGAGRVGGVVPASVGPAAAGAVAAATAQEEGAAAGAAAATDTAAQITQVVELCRGLPNQAYAVDCVAAGLADVASAMQRDKDQAAAKAALEKAARDLRALAQENRDPALPRVTARRGEISTSRPLNAVVPSPAVAAAADAIVAEAQTVLLRSAPADAAPEYNRISAALDSSRVLLRSS